MDETGKRIEKMNGAGKLTGRPTMRLCERCRDRMDRARHNTGTYYFKETPEPAERGICCMCGKKKITNRYEYDSVASVAMRAAIMKQKNKIPVSNRSDRRARYRGNWREEQEEN